MVASRALDNDGLGFDDDGEHMHRDFFGHKTDPNYVETNRRTILGDLTMSDDKAYQGKKVSRS